jgi:hypothetical protein
MLTINVVVGKAWTLVGESEKGFEIDSTADVEFATTVSGSPVVSRGHILRNGMSRRTAPGRLFAKGSGIIVATPIPVDEPEPEPEPEPESEPEPEPD